MKGGRERQVCHLTMLLVLVKNTEPNAEYTNMGVEQWWKDNDWVNLKYCFLDYVTLRFSRITLFMAFSLNTGPANI
jgi:hypothetical protein